MNNSEHNKYGEGNPEGVKKALEKSNAEWTPEGWVVEGNFDLLGLGLKKLPLIKSVGRDFDCSYNKLTSLEGVPTTVGEDFNCYKNQLISLEGAPDTVGGDFYCSKNNLTSLEGAPTTVGMYFNCSCNKLTSLEGAPDTVGGDFNCSRNQLTSLEGAPQRVSVNFVCYGNQLTSLEGAPSSVGRDFDCSYNKLTSLEGVPTTVGEDFYCYNNQLTSLEGAPDTVGGSIYSDGNPVNYPHLKEGVPALKIMMDMENKKYLVIPGYIDSKTDNDVHYMDAYRLIELYGVDHKECMIFERSLLKTINRDDFIVLNPLYDGNYEEVLKERLAAYESRE